MSNDINTVEYKFMSLCLLGFHMVKYQCTYLINSNSEHYLGLSIERELSAKNMFWISMVK